MTTRFNRVSIVAAPGAEARARGAARAARGRSAAGLMLCALALAGAARAQVLMPVPGPAFFHLKYADSLSSVNDRCVITHNRLNPVMHPVYVNGQPVGFC